MYLAALRYYNKRAFTYLELGDGDELWENRSIERIRQMHPHSSDPTSAAKNNTGKGAVEQRLTQWAAKQQVILIAGHTHRPFAGTKQSPYFNTGSCVHPAGITGIEIENRCMTLVKWSLDTRPDQVIFVKREALGNTVCVDQY